MTKKVSRKERNFFIPKLVLILCFFSILLLMIGNVIAADVAYIYKSKPMINKDVLSVFAEMNLSVETIQEKKIPASLSGYKFIYAGNERFTKNIPVNNYPSVITNYYFGEKWGLTDDDGISKLAATSPLSVDKNGQIIQVYIQAKYNGRSISLPYFYLGDLDKVPAMEKIAGSYVGSNPNFISGDVISFARAGTHLINGKDAKGNICFFGIVESKYWTSAARQLFIDCVASVALTCSKDSDCGNDTSGNNYCVGNGVFKNVTHHSCLNPGTVHSQCVTNTIVTSVENCTTSQVCSNGMCLNINCTQNSDCGTDGFSGNPFCQNNSVFQNFITYTCNNPGTPQSFCNSTISAQLNQTCLQNQVCSNGTCAIVNCYFDVECGVNGPVDGLFCQNNSVFRNFITFTCNNPGTPQSFCSNSTSSQLNKSCNSNETCSNGNCAPIICNMDSDCGINGFIGNPFCTGNDIFQNYINYTCNAPGTQQSYCSNSTAPKFKQACPQGQTCAGGLCVPLNITCYNDSQCDDYNLYTYDQCNNPGTPSSYCSHTPVNCVTNNDCGITGYNGAEFCYQNDVFKNFMNSSCINGGTPFSYCEIFVGPKLITDCGAGICQNATCIFTQCVDNDQDTYDTCNPGQPGDDGKPSDCNDNNANVHPNAVEICNGIDDDCDGQVDENLGSTTCGIGICQKTVNNCVNGVPQICTPFPPSVETCNLLDDDCDGQVDENNGNCPPNQQCINGQCIPVNCNNNLDCGINGFINGAFCSGDDVFKNYATFTCNNPGQISSYCSNITSPQIFSDCGDDYCGSFGANYCKWDNVYHNRTCHDKGCASGNCFDNANIDEQLVQDCTYNQVCTNGQCVPINIPCTYNSDCGTNGFIGNPFCQGNSILQNFITFTCNNPGTPQSFCSNLTAPQQIQTCPQNQVCTNGQCVPVNINCFTNNDCGANGFIGNEYCSQNDVFKINQTSICRNPGTSSSYCEIFQISQLIVDCGDSSCSDFGANYCKNGNVYHSRTCTNRGCNQGACTSNQTIDEQLVDECSQSETCSNGQCIPVNIPCSQNSDCGQNGFIDGAFCSVDDVFKNFITYTCNNPGQISSYCSNITSPQIFSDCGDDYCGSYGNNYCKNDDVYHSRTCHDKGCASGNCFDNSNIDEQLVQDCTQNQVCSNGQCVPIVCYNNSQCDDLNSHTYDQCINPGTPQSFCNHIPIICLNNLECGLSGALGSPFCQGNSIFQNFITYTCNNPGTIQSSCSIMVNPQLNQSCPQNQVCNNGVCVPLNIPCTLNSDCGINGPQGSPFCQGNSIFQNFINYVCNNPGTPQSFCSNSVSPVFNQSCPQNQVCNNGVCVPLNIPCFNDSQCNDSNVHTFDQCINPGTPQSFCNHIPIICLNNLECGLSGPLGSPFCQGNSIFQNFITYTCNNPGTIQSSCSISASPVINQTCGQNQVCNNGVCINQTIICSTNSQCGVNGFIGSPFCQGNDVFQNFKTYTCNNPGTPQSFCSDSTAPQLKQTCPQGQTCSGGVCVPVVCNQNSDCGTNGFIFFQTLQNVAKNKPASATKTGSGLSLAYVNNGNYNNWWGTGDLGPGSITIDLLSEYDAQSYKIACGGINGGNIGVIHFFNGIGTEVATKNYNCAGSGNGIDMAINFNTGIFSPSVMVKTIRIDASSPVGGDWINVEEFELYANANSDVFCQGNNVFGKFITYTCNNPGTAQSFCSNSTADQLKITCPNGQSCSNGICVPIRCSQNSDCGINGLLNQPFCQNGNVFDKFRTFTCNNPGTIQSYCTTSTTNQLKQTCPQGQTCSNGQCIASCIGSPTDQNPNVCATGCPGNCDGSDWFIGVPKGYLCSGSVTTLGDGRAMENDPKATQIFGGISGRLEPESPGGLATMNKFCQLYTGDPTSFATYGRVHRYCGGGNNNFWWDGSKWNYIAYQRGKLNIQEITCATGCKPC